MMNLTELEQNPAFIALKQQYLDVFAANTQPKHLAGDARKFAEAICYQIFIAKIGSSPSKFMELGEYLEVFKKKKLPLGYIYPQIETIQKVGNFNSHYQGTPVEITAAYIQPAQAAVDFLMNWFLNSQLNCTALTVMQGEFLQMQANAEPASESSYFELEMVGGAIPLHSNFYVRRQIDDEFAKILKRRDSIVLLKGARQVGKTSLLARGMQQAREDGMLVLITDFQRLAEEQLQSLDSLFIALADQLADQLNLDIYIEDNWRAKSPPNVNFDRYFRRQILAKTEQPVLWAMDEADRLFTCAFSSEFFALFRTWHNERAFQTDSLCSRLSLAIAYATETYLFIKDPNQSPFNVGTKLVVEDFTLAQVTDLNQRHGSPLSAAELPDFYEFVGGHPYLTRAGLYELVSRSLALAEFKIAALRADGIIGDHLRRLLLLLRDETLAQTVRDLLQNKPCADNDAFSLLRRVGILSGDSRQEARLRCQAYALFLAQHLL